MPHSFPPTCQSGCCFVQKQPDFIVRNSLRGIRWVVPATQTNPVPLWIFGTTFYENMVRTYMIEGNATNSM